MSDSLHRSSLLEEATQRAAALQNSSSSHCSSVTTPPQHPLEQVQQPQEHDASSIAESARKQWRNHGEGITQALEEKRRILSNSGLVVRVISAEERVDPSGSKFTAYVVSVCLPGTESFLVEHRYSDFSKLYSTLKKHSVTLNTGFPAKHWAGRMGNWTPSKAWAPQEYENLVCYRKIQLDLWLVDLAERYNRNDLPQECKTAVYEFLTIRDKRSCEYSNEIENTSSPLNRIKWSNPLSFTLGSSIRQAAHMVDKMTNSSSLSDSDQSIPLDLLRHAKGLVFLTVVKAGLVVSGRVGTGLVIAKQENGKWSAPSALGTVGMGWGALMGGDITHYLVVFTTSQGVDALCRQASLQLGAELGVAVGPIGRGASLSTGDYTLEPSYAYAHSQGFFIGMSLEGSVVAARHDVNAKFYGKPITPQEILIDGKEEPPLAAQPLYDAIDQALQVDIPKEGFRPSQLWSTGGMTTPTAASSSSAQTPTNT